MSMTLNELSKYAMIHTKTAIQELLDARGLIDGIVDDEIPVYQDYQDLIRKLEGFKSQIRQYRVKQGFETA